MLGPKEGQTAYEVFRIYDDESGALRIQQIRLDGLCQAPPDGSPSHEAWDELGRLYYRAWHDQDKDHRLDSFSSVAINPENGVHITEVYKIEGKPRPPESGPHIIRRDKETGEVTETLYAPVSKAPNVQQKNQGPQP